MSTNPEDVEAAAAAAVAAAVGDDSAIATAAAAAAAAASQLDASVIGDDAVVSTTATAVADATAAAAGGEEDPAAATDATEQPPKKKRKTKKHGGGKNSANNSDDLIDVLDTKAISKKIPLKEGKGSLFPPWTWRTSVEKAREWRDLSLPEQQAQKDEWVAMGMAAQDAFIREVRLNNQSKTLWLLARGGAGGGKPHGNSAGGSPSERLDKARKDYEKTYSERSKVVRETEEARAALTAAQAQFEAASGATVEVKTTGEGGGDVKSSTRDSVLAEAERALIEVELQESSPWNEMYHKLEAFQEKNGHVRVPSIKVKAGQSDPETQELYKLSAWVMRNRAMYKNFRDPPEDRNGNLKPVTIGQITPLRIDALEKYGFIWDTKEEKWREMFEEMRKFRDENGHMRVSLSANASLYRWADRQKLQYVLMKRGEPSHLSKERYEMLESIGFTWWNTSPQASQLKKQDLANDFDTYYQQLIDFKKKYGHTRVAHRKGTGSPEELEGDRVSWRLVQWVTLVRKQYKLWQEGRRDECKLDENKIRLLEEAGFEFTVSGRPQSFGKSPGAKTSSTAVALDTRISNDASGIPSLDDAELEAKVAAVAAEAVANAPEIMENDPVVEAEVPVHAAV